MTDVYVIGAARTPVGKRNGYLRDWHPAELLGHVLDEVVRRAGIDPALVEEVVNGTNSQVGAQAFTLGRMGVFASSLPNSVPGSCVNRQCGSSLTALHVAYAMIASDTMDVTIASGIEIMSQYGLGADMDGTMADGRPMGNAFGDFFIRRLAGAPMYNQAQAAQAIGEKWGINRLDCEKLALESHTRAHNATVNGYFKSEIVPTRGLDKEGNEITVENDQTIRPDTSLEKLAALDPALDTDWLTAGTSSSIADGASAVVLASGEKVKELGLEPMARIVANAVVGCDPELMLTGPLYATPKVLAKAGMKMDDIDIFECNEAFAPVPLAWAKELNAPMDRTNVNGGAMALGHPIGNTGTRLAITAIHELVRRQARYALVTMCTGGAMAPATIFERV